MNTQNTQQTLPNLLAQLEEVQRAVDAARKNEYANAVRQAKELIKAYGIAAKDLGFVDAAAPKAPRGRKPAADKAPAKRGRKPGAKAAARASKGSKVAPKFRDPATGATWTGRGKRPRWMSDALAAGRSDADFLIAAAPQA